MSTHTLSWSDFVTTTMSEVVGEDGDGQDMESEGIYTEVEDRLLRRFGVERSLTEVVTPW